MDIVPYLNGYLEMQDGGCQLDRHELLDEHWKWLGYMKDVRETYRFDQAKVRADRARADKAAQESG